MKHKYSNFIDVEIVRDSIQNNATVTIYSKIHKTKVYTLPHCYSLDFTDYQILNDPDFIKYVTRFL